jgi:hypothetical protein
VKIEPFDFLFVSLITVISGTIRLARSAKG